MDRRRAAVTAAWVYAATATFHVAVAAGAPWGRWTQGGLNPGVLPAGMRLIALSSALVLGCLAATVLAAVGLGPLRTASTRTRLWAMRATTGYSAVAVAANLATRSQAERVVWAPVSLLLLYLCLRVLRGMPTQ